MTSALAAAKLQAAGGLEATFERAESSDAADAAKQFEQLMLFELLKTMRATIPNSEDGSSGFSRETFDQMFDQALSEEMAGSFGLAPMIEKQLGGRDDAGRAAPLELKPLERPAFTPRASNAPAPAFERTTHPTYAAPVDGTHSSAFGWREHPISGERKFHTGLDIAAPEGTEIRAVQAGTVTHAGRMGGYGNVVELRHEDGTTTRYAHASRVHVRVGDRIEVGEAIADVGSTGQSTGPHLHFEVRRNGRAVDPESYLQGLQQRPETTVDTRPRSGVTNFSLARFVKAYEAPPEGG